jgi:hypothetical protein
LGLRRRRTENIKMDFKEIEDMDRPHLAQDKEK